MNRPVFQTILAALFLAGSWCRAAQPAGPIEAVPPAEVAVLPSAPTVPATESPAIEGGPSAEILEATAVEIAAVPVETSPVAPVVEPELPTWTVEPYAKEETAPLAATATTAGNNAASAAEAPVEPPDAGQNIATTPTGNVVINLINKLVERGVLTAGDARGMITQAQAEAETQKVQNESDMFAIAQIAAVQTMTDQALAEQTGMSAVDASRREMEADLRVSHIPAPVREQLVADIRRELAAGGVSIGGPERAPPGLPALLAQLKPEGEIRFRYEADLYPSGNDDTGAFPNFNAINTGNPFQINGSEFAPQWNTDQNRNRYRMLVRLGTGIELGDNFSAGLRMATGDNNSPVTANQSMGLANQGQGGQFSKYAIWLDRAYIRYDIGGGGPETGLLAVGAPYSMVGPGQPGGGAGATFWVGRFDNPFFSTPIIFDNDLGFDGAALRLTYNYNDVFLPSVVAGAFPVFNTDLNFSSNQAEKYPSYDKYLFAIQGGTQVNITRNWSTQVAAAYYSFYNIEGKFSSPYTQYSEDDAGDTDNSRPSFAQKGNTYRTLRNVVPPPGSSELLMDYQYFGLATPFQNLAFTGKLSYDGWDPITVSLIGEFVSNLAFNSSAINEVAVNNLSVDDNLESDGTYEGDPNAWLVDIEAGHAELDKLGAWQLSFGYRYVGSDAVVDGFNDSDFGLGGTNMKGFTLAGRVALSPQVYLGLRWYGSESIAGPQYDMNIFQVDLGAKF